jgi:hypothetical protein
MKVKFLELKFKIQYSSLPEWSIRQQYSFESTKLLTYSWTRLHQKMYVCLKRNKVSMELGCRGHFQNQVFVLSRRFFDWEILLRFGSTHTESRKRWFWREREEERGRKRERERERETATNQVYWSIRWTRPCVVCADEALVHARVLWLSPLKLNFSENNYLLPFSCHAHRPFSICETFTWVHNFAVLSSITEWKKRKDLYLRMLGINLPLVEQKVCCIAITNIQVNMYVYIYFGVQTPLFSYQKHSQPWHIRFKFTTALPWIFYYLKPRWDSNPGSCLLRRIRWPLRHAVVGVYCQFIYSIRWKLVIKYASEFGDRGFESLRGSGQFITPMLCTVNR